MQVKIQRRIGRQIEAPPNPHNIRYLRTKRDRMGHAINLADTQHDGGVCGHAQEGV